MKKEIIQILEKADKQNTNINPTILYNEGWMLRIILQKIKNNEIIYEDLAFTNKKIDWYSEALLPSPFSPRSRGDKLSESRTHADGVVGKFNIGDNDKNKGGLTLKDHCDFFYVIEAKMYSKLSEKTKNTDNYNQVARNIGCIAKLIYDNNTVRIDNFQKLGFYVLLPEEQIKIEKSFKSFTEKGCIKNTIKNRISDYPPNDDKKKDVLNWLTNNLDHIINIMDIKLITWEELIKKTKDNNLEKFYDKCKLYNKKQ